MIGKEFLSILACPKCKRGVKQQGMFITCGKCRLAYPLLDGNIPQMLIEDSWKLERARKAGFRHTLKL